MARDERTKFDPQKPFDGTQGRHRRRSIRLPGYDYSQAGAYFVTIVAYQRQCLFGEITDGEMELNDFGKIADECWRAIPEHFAHVELGAYVVMPNHVHGIITITETVVGAQQCCAPTSRAPTSRAPTSCAPTSRAPTLRAPTLRAPTSRAPTLLPKINVKPGSLGAIVRSFKSAVSYRINKEHNTTGIWQRNYYERIIRNEREMGNIWRYIASNPAHWDDDAENPRHYRLS